MLTHRIIEILKSFSKSDFKNFRDFLSSPFFNKSEKIKDLYEDLIVFYPDFNSLDLTKEKLHKNLYPKLEYNDSTLKNLLADISYLGEEYLKIINFQSNFIKSQDFLLDELIKRGLGKLFEKNVTNIEEILSDDRGIDADHFVNRYRLLTDKFNYNIQNKNIGGKSLLDSNVSLITERGKHLVYFFIIQMIKQYETLNTFKLSYNLDLSDNFIAKFSRGINFEETLRYLISISDKKDYENFFKIYLNLYLMFKEFNNEKHYYKFKELFLENINLFNLIEKRFLLSRLVQYCKIKRDKSNNIERFNKESLNVYKLIIDKGDYQTSKNDFIPLTVFRNIVIHSLKMKKYKWAEEFIVSYIDMIHPKHRENMHNYSLASLYFERGIYEKALEMFHNIKIDYFMFKLDLRNLMLKTYFELDLIENAFSLIDTYKHFLRNNRTLSLNMRKKHRNFVNAVHKLLLEKSPHKKLSIHYIEKKLKEEDNIESREWLLEKISEMKDGYKAVV